MYFREFAIGLGIAVSALTIPAAGQEGLDVKTSIDFQRDIRPILADTCYKCHGPDAEERKADLRVDTLEGLLDSQAVVPHDLDASELYQRIISDDPGDLMPPPDSGRKLTEEQKTLIRRWIESGAKWQNHWSLIAPTRPQLPDLDQFGQQYKRLEREWAANAIDRFVLAQLASRSLQPQDTPDRATLIRRVSFDLTGLPPSPELLASTLADSNPDWYERLVDSLLESPAYGEHMARYWLDVARYGDTHGLHLDNYREMWIYRDWVVNAFNRNLSYRDFTIEQLAGDMLPDATDDQRIASGFNRAHVTTNEGGSITEEVYVRNVVDRVSTTGTAFMGLTVGCAQCHDHKFDPISQKEFYQLFAYFNNMTDPPMDKNIKDPQPVLKVMNAEQRQQYESLTQTAKAAAEAFETALQDYEYVDPAAEPVTEEMSMTEAEALPAEASSDPVVDPKVATKPLASAPEEFVWVDGKSFPRGIKPGGSYQFVEGEKVPALTDGGSRKQSGKGTIQHFFTDAILPLTVSSDDLLFAHVYLDPQDPPESVMLQFNDGNWEHRVYWGENRIEWGTANTPARHHAGELPQTGKWVRLEVKAQDVGFPKQTAINGFAFTQYGGTAYWDTAGVVSKHPQSSGFQSLSRWIEFAKTTSHRSIPGKIKQAVKLPPAQRSEKQRQEIRNYFLVNINESSIRKLAPLAEAKEEAEKKRKAFDSSLPTTLVSKESDKIKEAFVLLRGEYDQKGDKVDRDTPAALPDFEPSMPNNRLGLALWLTSGQHPLTARVAVNRFWQQVFGVGIVKTSEDFGSQGDHPSHPALLDWLSVDFVEHGWDIKRLMKQIVMSSTYRQTSAAPSDLYQQDPENRLLARGPRFRLDAEALRDQALAVSGLLHPAMGGPSVKPPQQSGLWFAVGYSSSNTVRFKADQGADKVFRRSLYTFWKRTAPPPQMSTFDAPSREECQVRRERTNTPLQALLLMNEPQYVQAARHLAKAALAEASQHASDTGKAEVTDQVVLQHLFARALGRDPQPRELQLLTKNLHQHRQEFGQGEGGLKRAEALLSVGAMSGQEESADPIKLASLTMVANLVMNLDEFVNKN